MDHFLLPLRPGKYSSGGTDTAHHPLLLLGIQFFIVQQPFNAATARLAIHERGDFVSLMFTTQKMESKDNSLSTEEHNTSKAVRWRHYVAVPHIFVSTDTPSKILSLQCDRVIHRFRSGAPRSRPTSGPSSGRQAWLLVSLPRMLARVTTKRGYPWQSSWHDCTQTQSDLWIGGGATPFSATYTPL